MNLLEQGLGLIQRLKKADELSDVIDAIRQIELDEQWLKLVMYGDFPPRPEKVDRRGRMPIDELRKHLREEDGPDSRLYKLAKDDMTGEQRRVILAALHNRHDALSPIEGRRNGNGCIELRYFERGGRRYGPYAYLRVWQTGGDKDRRGSRLKSYYLGKDFANRYIDGLAGIDDALKEIGRCPKDGQRVLDM